MKVTTQSVNFNASADLLDFIEKKVASLSKFHDKIVNAEVFLKMENHQHTSSFKARGAINAIIAYKEKFGYLPKKIVAQSSGNHAQAIAFMCKKLHIKALIYMANIVPQFKVEATRNLGAEVIICEKRSEANQLAEQKMKEGYLFIHPSVMMMSLQVKEPLLLKHCNKLLKLIKRLN